MLKLNGPRILRLILPAFVGLGVLYFIIEVRSILSPFLLSVALSYLLNPLVELGQKKGLSRVQGILLVYFAGMLLVFVAINYGFPVFMRELDVFTETIPEHTTKLQGMVQEFYRRYRRIDIPESVRQVIDETLAGMDASLTAGVRRMAGGLIGLFPGMIRLVLVPVLVFYLLKDAEHITRRVVAAVPLPWRMHAFSLWAEVDRVLMKFIRGHLLVAFLVAVLTSIGLALIGVDFFLLLGLIAGIADLIPYFGPIIGTIPAVALALLDSTRQALYVLLVMVIVQQAESNFLSPKILGGSVGLHPVVVIFVLLAGGHLYGLLGMLLAVPLTAILRVVFNYAYTLLVSRP